MQKTNVEFKIQFTLNGKVVKKSVWHGDAGAMRTLVHTTFGVKKSDIVIVDRDLWLDREEKVGSMF
jgi:hypothetical protein